MAKRARRAQHGRRRAPARRQGTGPVGSIEINAHGYAFCETDEGSFFIPKGRLSGALPDDTVELRVSSNETDRAGKRTASVARVITRATEYLTGILEINDPLAVVVAQDPRVRHDLFVNDGLTGEAQDGDVVLARITTYPGRHIPMQGYIVEVLGQIEQPGIDIDIIIHNLGLPTGFSPQALEQGQTTKPDIAEALKEPGRRDLRMRDVFTIDPVDAKDFDDAVSLDEAEGMLRLGVHIADVSSYVAWDSPLDINARSRATSVYLVDRVLPMLPEVLSNDICSLKPGQDRLAMTCDMYLDAAAYVVRYELYPSVIRSRRRFNYDEVQGILDGVVDDPYAAKLRRLSGLAKQLLKIRNDRGALDFDSVEAKPVLDEAGAVVRIDLRGKTDATSMIEEAMICANETVATHLFKLEAPCVYRIHQAPQAASLEALLVQLKELGYQIQGLASGEPRAFQRVLNEAKGKPEEPLVNYMVLRAMERAVYRCEPLPHFGLASAHYCHFTSPIRRYPDLMVHRLLKDPHAMEGQLEWLARHSSKMERLAQEAERDSVELKLCEYMQGYIGKDFVGTITTVVARGLYVRLENTLEGFTKFDYLHDERFYFDPKAQTLVGEETGRTYRLGQQLRVRVDSVEPRERSVVFSVA